jgi:hypothetical protein
MIQPFEKFKAVYVDRLKKLNKKFLVTQTYHMTMDHFAEHQNEKILLLVSDYEDLSRAKTHWNAVKAGDKYAAIIHLDIREHSDKLMQMLLSDSPYNMYFAVVNSTKELENLLNTSYKDYIRRWIDKHTTWRFGKDATIRPSLQLIFGILYVNLKYAGQTIRVKFEEIEKS